MTDLEISQQAPTDEGGHPIHPERGHRICAATKSDRTTPTEHGRERDDIPYCTLAAGWGVDDMSEGTCRHHLGAVDNRGANNPNFKHGAFSEYLQDDLTEREREAIGDLVDRLDDPDEAGGVVRELVGDAVAKYKRSGDVRFLREIRQYLSDFNIAHAPEQLEVEHSGRIDGERTLELDDETQDAVRDVLRQRRGEDE